MGERMQNLCRLCAKKHEFSKDLLDESNKNILDLIRQFTQITVTECDNMPTRVCLDCEEKMVSFQLFVLECYKIQDSLRNLCLQTSADNFDVKTENLDLTVVKAEVKDELSAEDIINSALQDQIEEIDNNGDDYRADSSDEDELDNITIASLKQLKTKDSWKKNKPTRIYKKLSWTTKYIPFKCECCGASFRSWHCLSDHYQSEHDCKMRVVCPCGFEVKSKSVLYKHALEHKRKDKKLKRKLAEAEAEAEEDNDKEFNVKDYIEFKCESCQKICSSWYTLTAHCKRNHNTTPIVTCSCGVTLKSRSVMYNHVNNHRNVNTLACPVCLKPMKSLAALAKHEMRHVPVPERKYDCAECGKVLNSKDLLRSHLKSHIPIEERKVFNCDVCNMKFTTASSARSHRRVVHEKVKAYVCDQCGYACGTNGELRQHRAIHSDDKPHVCAKCNKSFKTYSNLKTHMDTHEDTSYVCYVCSRVLNSRRTLRKHLLVHEDKCIHVCSYCNKAFKRRQTLKVHMTMHTGVKPLTCKWCEERFSYASTLRSHRLRVHPDKMAAAAVRADTYHTVTYSHQPLLHHEQENYIKSDLAAIGITKNETGATQ